MGRIQVGTRLDEEMSEGIMDYCQSRAITRAHLIDNLLKLYKKIIETEEKNIEKTVISNDNYGNSCIGNKNDKLTKLKKLFGKGK